MSAILQERLTVQELAFKIADDSAQASIECHCEEVTGRRCNGPAWWDTTKVDVAESPADREFIDEALLYLEMRELLVRHPDDSTVVSFRKAA